MFFEEFEVPAFYVVDTAVLQLYNFGKTTGLIIEFRGV
jgi:actin-related protein